MAITVRIIIENDGQLIGDKTFVPNFAAGGGPEVWAANALRWAGQLLAPSADLLILEAQEQVLAARRAALLAGPVPADEDPA